MGKFTSEEMNTVNPITSIQNVGNNNYESLGRFHFCHLVVGVKLTTALFLAMGYVTQYTFPGRLHGVKYA